MEKLPKIFVLDTNVILHDYRAVFNFQENDLVIPMAVLEELDKFKKGDDQINYNAREFVRELDKITDARLFNHNGYPLGKGRGKLMIELTRPFPRELQGCFMDDIQDHRILATTIWVKTQNPNRLVALVTKDVNLRMKAKALHIIAQDYLTGQVKEERVKKSQKEIITVKGLDFSLLEKILNNPAGAHVDELHYKRPACNQLYRFKCEEDSRSGKSGKPVGKNIKKREDCCEASVSSSENRSISAGLRGLSCILARYNHATQSIVAVKPRTAYGISPRNEEQTFALDVLLNPDIKLVSLTGTAGTGKTLLALAAALTQADQYDQILLARPVIPLKNQEIGFLPGDAKEKIGPYMLPLYDNLSVIKKNFGVSSRENVRIEDMLRTEKLLISPLAYIRGRSLSKVFFIVDEAQNLTPHEVKTIITRAGEGTKIVFTGDIQQIDQPYLDKWSNGLTHLGEKLYGEELFAHINLIRGERSELSELAGKKL